MTDVSPAEQRSGPEATKAKLNYSTLKNIHRRNRELVQDRFLNRGRNPVSQENRGLVSDIAKDQTRTELEGDMDGLTGLLNKKGFMKRYEETINHARRNGEEVWVAVFDANGLKQINDDPNGGHEAGNEYLRSIAVALAENGRNDDFVGRTGGDEFVVVFKNPGENGVEKWWERKVGDIKQKSIRISGGAIQVDLGSKNSVEAIDEADHAMYAAKLLKGDGESHFMIATKQDNNLQYKEIKQAA